ncbi:MAG: hypothetical protein QXR87_06295 [Candidatus Hadarchaeales archaeon]
MMAMKWWSIRRGKKGRRVLKEMPAPCVTLGKHLDFSTVFEVPGYIA